MYLSTKRFLILAGAACLGLALAAAANTPAQAAGKAGGAPGKAAESLNMRLLGHDPLGGRSTYRGHVQKQGDSYIAYAGHHGESGKLNGLSIVDVTDPRNPVFLTHLAPTPPGNQSRNIQTCAGDDLPGGIPGNYYMTREVGGAADVHELWNVTDPAIPVFMATIESPDGTHKNWWECETGIAYLTSDLPGWATRGMSIFDISDPESFDPSTDFIRHYSLPGAEPGGDPAGRRMPSIHEPLYMDGKVYMAYGTRADGILQILDNEVLLNNCVHPEPCALAPTEEDLLLPQISRLDWPDFQGVHTAVPMLGMDVPEFAGFDGGEAATRDMVVVVNESTRNECDWDMHQIVYIVDITDPVHPIPVSTWFVPEESGNFCERGGRFGAHAMQWNLKETIFNKRIAWISYFNAGVRGVDIRDPYNPKEVAFYIPAVTENTTPRGGKFVIQTNNLDVDDRGLVYIFDRANTGMHILEVTGLARQIANFDD